MLKVFLAEDESIVRQGLRDNMPWEQYGFQFAGEASDGEMALPMIRKLKPDVLFTDIKMPFMDGLALSRMVRQEFPEMRIVIISGYDDFDYAREAIQIGVEQYLVKPITKNTMAKVLTELREKIENQKVQNSYQEKFQEELREYERFSRRNFFEKLFEGKLSVQEIYEQAAKLNLELHASCYNLVLFTLQEKKNAENRQPNTRDFAVTQDEVMRTIMRYPENMVFRWNVSTYGVLIKGSGDQMEELTRRCVENIREACQKSEAEMDWYVAAGDPVERLSSLTQCYSGVNHIFAYRFLMPQMHVLSAKEVQENAPWSAQDERGFTKLDSAQVDPKVLRDFLETGSEEDMKDFVESYLQSIQTALQSKLFRDYLMLSIRFTTLSFVGELGCSQEEFFENFGQKDAERPGMNEGELKKYLEDMLRCAIRIRDNENTNQGKRILKRGLDYISENFTSESLSLNQVAAAVNVSANYFSALFSQEMEETFIEYVTKERMELAKKLLRQTDKHSGEIALEVGYKDPHYFSFVFKKTQGCTTREYRQRFLS